MEWNHTNQIKMITKLLETDLLAFQEKFYFFGDAVVSSLSFDYQNKQFRVILEAQDSSESIQPCWRYVTLIVKRMFFHENNTW